VVSEIGYVSGQTDRQTVITILCTDQWVNFSVIAVCVGEKPDSRTANRLNANLIPAIYRSANHVIITVNRCVIDEKLITVS